MEDKRISKKILEEYNKRKKVLEDEISLLEELVENGEVSLLKKEMDAMDLKEKKIMSLMEKGRQLNDILSDKRETHTETIKRENKIHLFKHFSPMQSSRIPNESLFYDIEGVEQISEKLFNLSNECYVEQIIDGYPVTIHKNSEKVIIFDNQGNDVAKKFGSISKQVQELKSPDVIVDGKIVALVGKSPTGRRNVENFITGKSPFQETQMVFIGTDVPYFDGVSHEDSTLYVRKKLLASLELNSYYNLKEVGFTIAKQRQDLEMAINMISKLPASDGALIKERDSIYSPEKPSDKWVELRTAKSFNLSVVSAEADSEGNHTYELGIPVKDDKQKFVLNGFLKENNMVVGKLKSEISANVGDVVEVLLKEVHRHRDSKEGVGYSIHGAKIVSRVNAGVSSLSDIDERVVKSGIEVNE